MDAEARHRMLQMAGVSVAMRVPPRAELRDDLDEEYDDESDDLEDDEDSEQVGLDDEDLEDDEDVEDEDLEDDADEDPAATRHRMLQLLGVEVRARYNPAPGRQVLTAEGAKKYGLPIGANIVPGMRALTAAQQDAVHALSDEDRPKYLAARKEGATHAAAMKAAGVGPAKKAAAATDKGRRILGPERAVLAKDIVKRYVSGTSIQEIADSTGRSYGFVHRVLVESGVQLRQRGAQRPRRAAVKKTTPPAAKDLDSPVKAVKKAAPAKATPRKATTPEPSVAAPDPADLDRILATEGAFVRALDAKGLTAQRLRQLAASVELDVPDNIPNSRLRLVQFLAQRREHPGLAEAVIATPAAAPPFDADEAAKGVLGEAGSAMGDVSGVTIGELLSRLGPYRLAELRRIAGALSLPIPATPREGGRWTQEALRRYIAENIIRDRTRWSLRALGEDTHPGGDRLHHWWTKGPGLARWRTSPHPWTTLRNLLLEHMSPGMANRAASKWFREVFGYWSGSRKGDNPVGPG